VGVGKAFVSDKERVELVLTGYYHLVNLHCTPARPLAMPGYIPIDMGLTRQHLAHVWWLSMTNTTMPEMQCAT
jgi:hypothetical protein